MSLEINGDDCKVIVKRFIENDRFLLENFLIKPLENDNINGYSCKYANLIVDINTDNGRNRLQFFCKTLLDECIIGHESGVNSLEKETFVYKHFCKNFAPKFLHSINNTLIIEDLTLNGYTIVDEDYLDINHLKLTLNCLVKLHANSIIYEEDKGNNYKLCNDFRKYFKETLHSDNENHVGHQFTECGKEAVCTIVDLIPTFNENDRTVFKKNLNEEMKEFYKLINKSNPKYRNVCNHGDIWRKNLMFRYDDGLVVDCKLIDFQLCRYLPPAHDVTIAIHHLGSNELRQESYDYLLDYYYNSLADELAEKGIRLENILPRSEFEFTCKLYALPAKILRAIYTSLSSTSQESQKELFADPIKAMEVSCKDRSSYVVNEYNKNERYRSLMTKVIKNLNDALLNKDVVLEDCHKILREIHQPNYVLLDYYMKPFNKFAGYLGEYKILKTVLLDCNGERVMNSFFVKMMPKLTAPCLYLCETGGHFKEYGFYKNILPKCIANDVKFIEENVPKCYMFRLDDLVIFENLKSQNYIMLDKRKCLNYDVVKFTLKHIAMFHGSFYLLEEKLSERYGKPYRLIDEFPREFKESFFSNRDISIKTWNAVIKGAITSIDLFFKYNPSMLSDGITKCEFKERTKILLNGMVEYVKPSTKYRNTVCHGDLWASNILYKFDHDKPVKCKFVDYQSYRYICPSHDILTFLYIATDRKFRKEHLNELLDYYYDELNRFMAKSGYDLNDILSYEDYLNCCEYDKKSTLANYVSLSQMTLVKPEMAEEMFSVPGFDDKIILNDRSELIVKICEEDDVCKEKIMECVMDLKDYLFN